jgi:hypothetical protein
VADSSKYLTIRFEGPEVGPGRMRLDDFIQAAREFSSCAKRVAMVLQQTPSTVKGRRPEELIKAVSLDIVGFSQGSPAAVAYLERSGNQMLFGGVDFGEQTYQALIEGIEMAARLENALPPGFDLGVLMKLRDIGKLFNRGVNRVEFTLNHRPLPVRASFDVEKCDQIRHRIEQPEAQRQAIEGRLLMADFKETGRQLRVHPTVGPAMTCKFPESLSSEVEECIRRFVRVTGRMQYHPTGEPQYLEVTDIEPVEDPGALKSTFEEPNWSYSFWENPSAEEYARRQGVEPLTDRATLYGSGDPRDWEGFDEALEEWRRSHPLN